MSGRRVVVLVVALIVVIGAGVVLWPRGATPVSEADAIEQYREQADDTTAQADEEPDPDSSTALPAPGVYRFTTTGTEDVKLGVLPTEHREYPEEVTAIVVHGDDDCFTFTLNLLEQHTEDTTYCRSAEGGLRIDSHQKHQRIGPLSPTATMVCDPDLLMVRGSDGEELRCTLDLDGGPAQLTAELTGTSSITTDELVTVAGQDVPATRIDVEHDISGDLSGAWQERIWFAEDDLMPVRVERVFDLSGLAAFTERSELVLAGRQPAA